MTEFKREPRYVVFKIKDVKLAGEHYLNQLRHIGRHTEAVRKGRGKLPFNAAVVEQDWPEFEVAWRLIEARMHDGRIQCLTCGTVTTGLEVRSRNVHRDRCFACAEFGITPIGFKIVD